MGTNQGRHLQALRDRARRKNKPKTRDNRAKSKRENRRVVRD